MNKQELKQLAEQVADHSATDQQLQKYNHYIEGIKGSGDDWDVKEMGEVADTKNELFRRIDGAINKHRFILIRRLYMRIAAAAILLISISVYFILSSQSTKGPSAVPQEITSVNDVKPGGNKATLILANGKNIDLELAKPGVIADEMGLKIIKRSAGELQYIPSSLTFLKAGFHMLITPRGGIYSILLPDGSKVWLNSASSLKFPPTFNSMTRREVQLSGEAYFEIFKDKQHPFVVLTNQQQVEVLGTHFNINSYPNEPGTKTTLIEGIVRVSLLSGIKAVGKSSLILKPGQESTLTDYQLNVLPAEIDERIAWQRGRFIFDDEHIKSIMRKICRWYNVDAVYPEQIPDDLNFSGSISRNKNLSQILRIMEMTKCIHFKISGRTLYVMPDPHVL
ncbi:FecR family protein [Pedobacter sp. GR22-6]|uniref:FecR family protein n=1 Tax=Pedobacter sp. GR22-6 TaxID=3127957 RepID=UPI00307D6C5E